MMKVDQELQVEVVRTKFFRGERGETLAWRESSPPEPPHEHQQCNCTKVIAEHPKWEPFEIQTAVKMKQQGRTRDFSVTLGEKPWFTFQWGKSRAYFVSDKALIRGTIPLPGYGNSDCFFGNLFFGKNVDISTLMNGHSPSRIIDLSKLSPEDVWVHQCNFGKEALALITDLEERKKWWEARALLDRIEEISVRYEKCGEPVNRLRERVAADERLIGMVAQVRDWFAHVLDHLQSTDYYRAADEAYKKAHPIQRGGPRGKI